MNEMKHAFLQTELKNWSDIFKINYRFFNHFIFRGQGDANWFLESALERHIKKYYPNNSDWALLVTEEYNMLKEFQWKYPLHSNIIPDKEDLVEWFTIMQHYGAPTRLIDFTESLFIALFFAIAYHNSNSSAIWAINKMPIRHRSFENYYRNNNVVYAPGSVLESFSLEQANNSLKKNRYGISSEGIQLHLVQPKHVNERISNQQGIFLMQSDLELSFHTHLMHYISNDNPIQVEFNSVIDYFNEQSIKQEEVSVIKVIIPNRLNFEIAQSLRAMNLTAEHLFPGLEGLAKSLTYLRYEGMGNFR